MTGGCTPLSAGRKSLGCGQPTTVSLSGGTAESLAAAFAGTMPWLPARPGLPKIFPPGLGSEGAGHYPTCNFCFQELLGLTGRVRAN